MPFDFRFLGLMPALCEEDDVLATKLVTYFPHNLSRYDKPTHHAVIVVFSPQTGIPRAVGNETISKLLSLRYTF